MFRPVLTAAETEQTPELEGLPGYEASTTLNFRCGADSAFFLETASLTFWCWNFIEVDLTHSFLTNVY